MTEVLGNTLVDGRYRVIERIGVGGMADVYRAEDVQLGRDVALKVLHRRFAQDAEFVERFRREARAAAALVHPNVVTIFNRGEYDGTYYIAMEYLRGRPLKELIAERGPLPEEQAIAIAVQIARAAGFAHEHGVIHRDLKSQNVIVDDELGVKVTDFGIARAGPSDITETGSIMGTAQYLSPEQAQGLAVTPRSDLYSIGVILFEMLTGRLPFSGESAVAVALKHISERPPAIGELRPDVSPRLAALVERLLAKDPAERPASAAEVVRELEAVRLELGKGSDATSAMPAIAAAALSGGAAAGAAPTGAPQGVADPDGSPIAGGAAPPGDEAHRHNAGDGDGRQPRRRRLGAWLVGLLVVVLAGVLGWLAASALLAPERVPVPRVVGKQLFEARQTLERAGFAAREVRVRSERPAGEVVDQDPNPGVRAERGSTVTLEVSEGPGEVRIPSVAGLPRGVAIEQLNDAGLKVMVDAIPSNRYREGLAVRTVPAEGTLVERGTRVRLFVSSGPRRVTVPEVVGLTQDAAEAELQRRGLEVRVRERPSEEREGTVIDQDPAAGSELKRGDTVTIVVSTGPERVTVPNVVGSLLDEARASLRAAGLKVTVRRRAVSDATDDGRVVDQSPSAGVEVERGTDVVLFVGKLASGVGGSDSALPEPGAQQP